MNGSFIFYTFLFSPACISPVCTEPGPWDSEGGRGSRALYFHGENEQAAAYDSSIAGKDEEEKIRKTNQGQSLALESPVGWLFTEPMPYVSP